MSIRRKIQTQTFSQRAVYAAALAGLLSLCGGCGEQEKEKEPIVSVQTTPAQRAPIAQVVSVEAVVFPLGQAAVAPKITSNVKKFYVQRGTRVKKGQRGAALEEAELSPSAAPSTVDSHQTAPNNANAHR